MTISRKTYGKRLLDSLTSIHISTLNLWPVILRLDRAHDWVKQPMSLKEVDTLLSIIIAMGIVRYPTIRYKKYTLHIHLYI